MTELSTNRKIPATNQPESTRTNFSIFGVFRRFLTIYCRFLAVISSSEEMSWFLQLTDHMLESIKTEVIAHQVYKIKMSCFVPFCPNFVPLLTLFFQRDIFGAGHNGTKQDVAPPRQQYSVSYLDFSFKQLFWGPELCGRYSYKISAKTFEKINIFTILCVFEDYNVLM